MTKKEEVKLRVMEAMQEEAYKGIVRIDSQDMRDIKVRPGDIVEIEGERKTVGIVDRAYPTDIGESVIRMDGILRRNAKTGIGDYVNIRKIEVKEAKKVTIAPSQKGIMIRADSGMLTKSLLGRVVVKGDIISLGGSNRRRSTLSGSPFEEVFGEGPANEWYYPRYDAMNEGNLDRYHGSAGINVIQSVHDYVDYGYVVYRYGSTVIYEYVEQYMQGDHDAFFEVLKVYYNQYNGKNATIDEFISLIESETNIDETDMWFTTKLSSVQRLDE